MVRLKAKRKRSKNARQSSHRASRHAAEHNEKEYDDTYSRQYDQSRIKKELLDFYNYTHDPVTNINNHSKVNHSFGHAITGYDIVGKSKSGVGSVFEQMVDVEYEFDLGSGSVDDASILNDFSTVEEDEEKIVSQAYIEDIDEKVNFHIEEKGGIVDGIPVLRQEQEQEQGPQSIKKQVDKLLPPAVDEFLTCVEDIDEKVNSHIKDNGNIVDKIAVLQQEQRPQSIKKQVDKLVPCAIDEFSIMCHDVPLKSTKMFDESFQSRDTENMKYPTEIQFYSQDFDDEEDDWIFKNEKKKTDHSVGSSHISYDEFSVTPSIAFFLRANKEELRSEGFSIAGNETYYGGSSILHSIKRGNRREFLYRSKSNSSQTDETKETSKGHSVGSSKHTTDTPKVTELRERKRYIEQQFMKKTKSCSMPSVIEVARFSPNMLF